MRGPAVEGVQSKLFSFVTIIAQRHCVEFAKFKPPHRRVPPHYQIFAMSRVEARNNSSISTLRSTKPCFVPTYRAADRTGFVAAWEARALRGGGNGLLVVACHARYFSGKGERP
jgi:hypothetical protein